MLISKETDYAIRMIRRLADGKRYVISELCKTEYIPHHFGYKIAEKLQAAGILHNTKGHGGGCRLAVDLHKVTMHDLMEAIGSECHLNHCLISGNKCSWKEEHDGVCNVHSNLSSLQEEVDAKLQSMSLHSVIFG